MKYLKKLYFIYQTRGFRILHRAIRRELIGSLLKFILKRRFTIINVFDFRLIVDLYDQGISRTLWLFGERELDHKWIMEKTLSKGSNVIDIGANIGYYTLIESGLIGKEGTILAVEPSPDNVKLLKKNLDMNGINQIVVLQAAVSNVAGSREFYLALQSNLNTFHKSILDRRGSLQKGIQVDTFTIGELSKRYGPFDYLRMDIEGHEVEVLQDVVKMSISGQKCPDIVFETHINTYGDGHDIGSVLKDLEKVGYSVKLLASSSERGTAILEALGSSALKTIRTDEVYRTIHRDVPMLHLVDCLEKTGGVRTVFLAHRDNSDPISTS